MNDSCYRIKFYAITKIDAGRDMVKYFVRDQYDESGTDGHFVFQSQYAHRYDSIAEARLKISHMGWKGCKAEEVWELIHVATPEKRTEHIQNMMLSKYLRSRAEGIYDKHGKRKPGYENALF